MLRGLVVGLLLANAIFWAWTQGWLTSVVGIDPLADHEPQRLQSQIAPEAIRILPPASPGTSGAGDPDGVTVADAVAGPCVEAGPFSASDFASVEPAVRATLPTTAWTTIRRDKPGSWFIYMGRYPGREALQRKVEELKRLDVEAEELHGFADLEPGLVLGRYRHLDDAQAGMKRLAAQHVRTARLVQLLAPQTTHLLRVGNAGPDLQAPLASLQARLRGHVFSPCRTG